jgi:hypothetical protein
VFKERYKKGIRVFDRVNKRKRLRLKGVYLGDCKGRLEREG